MSTKIYNGYRLPGTAHVAAVARDLDERTRPAWQALAVQAVAATALILAHAKPEATVSDVAEAVSAGQVTGTGLFPTTTLLSQAAKIVDAVNERLSGRYAQRVILPIDLIFSVAFVADPADPAWTYALAYTDQPELLAVWEATAGVEPWPYWNNSDQPDEVTDVEWERRRQVWDRVLGWDPPAKVGVSWQYHGDDLVFAVGKRSGQWLTAAKVAAEAARMTAGSDRPVDENLFLKKLAGPGLPDPAGAAPAAQESP